MKYNKTFFNAFIICIIIFLSACSSVDIYDVPTVDDFGNTNGNIHEGGYAVYKNGWIYYTNTDDNDSLYKKRVDGSDSEKMISSGYCYAINVIDDWIYYISGIPGYVYRVSIDGTKKEKVDNRRSDNLIAVKSTLYYRITELTQGAICKLDLSSMKKKMIKKNVVEFSIDDKNIYYSDNTDNCNLYRTDFDGKNTVKINEDDTKHINIVDNEIYYSNNSDGNKLYKMKSDGTNKTILTSDACWNVNLHGEYIYYRNQSKKGSMYRIKTDGKENSLIVKGNISNINIASDFIVYYKITDGTGYYKANLDGSNEQRWP